jgi:hypothetical protein
MSHTYAQNVIHVVFSTKDLLQVSPRFNLSSRLGPFSPARGELLASRVLARGGPCVYFANRRVRWICLGMPRFDLVISLP